jgi:hypothetical protein
MAPDLIVGVARGRVVFDALGAGRTAVLAGACGGGAVLTVLRRETDGGGVREVAGLVPGVLWPLRYETLGPGPGLGCRCMRSGAEIMRDCAASRS